MDLIVLIGLISSVVSLVSWYLALPTTRSRFIHIAYGIGITIVSSCTVYYWQQASDSKSFEIQAEKILNNTWEGDDRAVMLAALSLVEKHKNEFPETYAAAKTLCQNAGLLGVQQTGTIVSPLEGANTMRGLLLGLGKARR